MTHGMTVEISNISRHGVWLLAGEREMFMSYEDFPWFKDVPAGKVLHVEEPRPGHSLHARESEAMARSPR